MSVLVKLALLCLLSSPLLLSIYYESGAGILASVALLVAWASLPQIEKVLKELYIRTRPPPAPEDGKKIADAVLASLEIPAL